MLHRFFRCQRLDIDRRIAPALVQRFAFGIDVRERLIRRAGDPAQRAFRNALQQTVRAGLKVDHRPGGAQSPHAVRAVYRAAACGNYRIFQRDVEQYFLLHLAQMPKAVLLQACLQRALFAQLDVEIGIDEAFAQRLCQKYTDTAFAASGHADQTDGLHLCGACFAVVPCVGCHIKTLRCTARCAACVVSGEWLEWRLFAASRNPVMSLLHTPLDALHRELGARMVPFAGYEMPVQYSMGILKEHLHTRQAAGLFDVSHMGQLVLQGPGSAALLESLVPVDIESLGEDRQTYALLTNEAGGVRDDLIVARWSQDCFFLVVNAACKAQDIAYIQSQLNGQELTVLSDQALLALQGPAAREVMRQLCPAAAELVFMQGLRVNLDGIDAYITCSGYTGEDGFEISIGAADSDGLARRLLAFDQVEAIGLGARDSLRLEAGLCLYGHELAADIDPVQSGVVWSISKARRPGGARPGGFPGADIIFERMAQGTAQRKVGLQVTGKRPVREGQEVFDAAGNRVGHICSAGYGASVGGPIAMAFVASDCAAVGTELTVSVRDKHAPVSVVALPFHPQRYYRG